MVSITGVCDMTTKKKPASAPPDKRPDMTVEQQENESGDKALARLAGSATFRAAVTERQFIGTATGGSELNAKAMAADGSSDQLHF
jgi:hypothetical protein